MSYQINNYAKLVRQILQTAINDTRINTSFSSDIYEINSMSAVKYPVFVCAPTEPQIEHENSYEFRITLYYIDRVREDNENYGSAETIDIHSAGITVLGDIIRNISEDPSVIRTTDDISYTLWDNTALFADICTGVFVTISIWVPKETPCF